jgi:hypothetical protein
MKHTLGTNEAVRLLLEDENANWSREGAEALVEFLEQLEIDTDQEIEFDRVAFRCEWSEYDRAKDAALDYSWSLPARDEDETDEEYHERTEEEALEYLQDNTTVLLCGDNSSEGVVIQCF